MQSEGSDSHRIDGDGDPTRLPQHPALRPTLPADAANAANAEADGDLTGQKLGNKYCIRRLLGKGGFGSVYEAEDEMLGAPVAVKVLNRDAQRQDDALQRFRDEARLLTNLDHPNIVRWITFDRTPGGL